MPSLVGSKIKNDMSSKEQEVEIKNSKALLSSLRNDIIQASTALSKILADVKVAEKQLEDVRLQLETDKASSLSVIELCDMQRADAKRKIQDAEGAVVRSKNELATLKTQKKEAMSELKNLNEWIFTAEERKKELDTDIVSLEKTAKEKEGYISDIADFKALSHTAKEEHRLVLVETKLANDESEALAEKSRAEVQKNKKELAEIEAKKKVALEELRKTQRHDKKVREELQIYIERVEKAHTQAFPQRTMKLSKR